MDYFSNEKDVEKGKAKQTMEKLPNAAMERRRLTGKNDEKGAKIEHSTTTEQKKSPSRQKKAVGRIGKNYANFKTVVAFKRGRLTVK